MEAARIPTNTPNAYMLTINGKRIGQITYSPSTRKWLAKADGPVLGAYSTAERAQLRVESVGFVQRNTHQPMRFN